MRKRSDDQDVRKNKTSLLTFRSLMVKRAPLKAGKSNGDPLRSDSFPGSLGLPRWRPCQIPDPGTALCQNPDPGESWLSQFPVGSSSSPPPLPRPWGLTLIGALFVRLYSGNLPIILFNKYQKGRSFACFEDSG